MRQFLLPTNERKQLKAYLDRRQPSGNFRETKLRIKAALSSGQLLEDLSLVIRWFVEYSEAEMTTYVKYGDPLDELVAKALTILVTKGFIPQTTVDELIQTTVRRSSYRKDNEETRRIKHLRELLQTPTKRLNTEDDRQDSLMR